MITTYNHHCKKCGKKTRQTVYLISRKRGVKLRCLICGSIGTHYIGTKLEEWTDE